MYINSLEVSTEKNLFIILFYCTQSHVNDFVRFYRPLSGTCTCSETKNNTKFSYNDGLWCCKSSEKKCVRGTNYPYDTKCHGKVLTLAEQCHVEGNPICNHYPADPDRNYYAPRSFLNLCKDNRYVFHI